MPVKISRNGKRYRVTDAGRVTAKATSRTKAERQARLLRAVTHGWHPARRRK
jgi:hypothetical protein